MSAANPLPDSTLHTTSEALDDASEESLPTQPWHPPPATYDVLGALETEFDEPPELTGFDLHDTIPAPPWLDEPGDALETAVLSAR